MLFSLKNWGGRRHFPRKYGTKGIYQENMEAAGIYQEKRKGLEIGVSKTLPNLLAHPRLNIAGCLLHFPVNNECDYGS